MKPKVITILLLIIIFTLWVISATAQRPVKVRIRAVEGNSIYVKIKGQYYVAERQGTERKGKFIYLYPKDSIRIPGTTCMRVFKKVENK